ncbi:MAG TPA: DUF4097 family beta strand repeat-containing protein, partial [Vicinamibacterales bacterium]|nr:DUF4097 family beta strand repeat-containing protein [Vicinamibacterales bacterium]
AALAAAVFVSGCVVSIDSQAEIVREERQFSVAGVPDLHVATFDGSIEVRSWDQPMVRVEIEKRGATREAIDALEISTTQDGDRIEVDIRHPRTESFRGIGFHHSASAKLTVSLPRRSNLRARSGDGAIRIEGVDGRIDLRTGDGTIRATDVTGDLIMNTGDGSVTVDGAEGRVEVDTGDGGISIGGRVARLRLHTGDGSIVVRAEPETRMTEQWEITTGDGNVALYLPPGFGAELDAHTGDGTIQNEFGILNEGGERSRRTLRGRLGEGGPNLRIRSGDGSIRLRRS